MEVSSFSAIDRIYVTVSGILGHVESKVGNEVFNIFFLIIILFIIHSCPKAFINNANDQLEKIEKTRTTLSVHLRVLNW